MSEQKNIFKVKEMKSRLGTMSIGEKGFTLINPLSVTTEFSSLFQKTFVLSTDLIYLPKKEQAQRYINIVQMNILIIGIERIGAGFTSSDFRIDINVDDEITDLNFNDLAVFDRKLDIDSFLQSKDYICFENIEVSEESITPDEYMDYLESVYTDPEVDYDGMELAQLYEVKEVALEDNDFELVAELDVIIKRKEEGGEAAA